MKPGIIPPGLTGKELFEYVVKNEQFIISAKKSEMKKADGIACAYNYYVDDKGELVNKELGAVQQTEANQYEIDLSVVGNTTNWFDSHWDVHIPGIWDRSIKNIGKAGIYLLDYHEYTHEAIIGENMIPKVVNTTWKELGFKGIEGTTQALFVNGKIYREDNEDAFDFYKRKKVKQHSVGMEYVKMVTCINDDNYPVQKENWDKYAPMVANIKDAEAVGIFWAITEAKLKEVSKVLFGSNPMTPDQTKDDPVQTTHNTPDPVITTQASKSVNWARIMEGIKETAK